MRRLGLPRMKVSRFSQPRRKRNNALHRILCHGLALGERQAPQKKHLCAYAKNQVMGSVDGTRISVWGTMETDNSAFSLRAPPGAGVYLNG